MNYSIKDSTRDLLVSKYGGVTVSFNSDKTKALEFNSLKRASKVLANVLKLVPDSVQLEIVPSPKQESRQ